MLLVGAGHSYLIWSRDGILQTLAQHCKYVLGTATGYGAGILPLAYWHSIVGVCWAQLLGMEQEYYPWLTGTAL